MTQEVLEALTVSETTPETEEDTSSTASGPPSPQGEGAEEATPMASPRGEAVAAATDEVARTDRLRASVAAHLDSLYAQAEELRREFPDFELDEALRDPEFLRLTAPGVGVDLRRAYYALHREALDARAAEKTRSQLARSLSSLPQRPREGGGLQAGAPLAGDYRSLSREQQQKLKQRIIEAAARGEKLYP